MQETVSSTEEEKEDKISLEASLSDKREKSRSYESLWGGILFACMLLFVVLSIGAIGFNVYSQWREKQLKQNEPSISALSQKSQEEAVGKEEKEELSVPEVVEAPIDEVSVKKRVISVLNGGGKKGSAGIVATSLKGEGYLSVTAGNTLKDYTGVTVYFSSGLDKEAQFIKEILVKKYPQVKVSPADIQNKETETSQITVILGK